jgi:hypothetical protein
MAMSYAFLAHKFKFVFPMENNFDAMAFSNISVLYSDTNLSKLSTVSIRGQWIKLNL